MTEHVSSGIISNKQAWARGRRVATLTVAACLVLSCACARRGSPVSADGDGEPSGYRLVSMVAIEGYAEDVEVAGGLAVLAAGQGGLVLVNVSDPASPSVLGSGSTEFRATGCAYAPSDSLAYVTSGSRGAFVYDVSDPTDPVWLTRCDGSSTRDIVVVEATPDQLHFVFGADGVFGIRVWRLDSAPGSDVWFPQVIGTYAAPGSAGGIWLEGELLFLAMEEVGLSIFDVGNPGSLVWLGYVDTPGEARAVASNGSYAYVADWRRGLQVIDVSDPAAPEIVGTFDTDGNADGIYYKNDRAYVADHVGGLRVFDVSDPTLPTPAGYYETPFANAVFVTDDYVFVADRDWGLVILEEDDG